MSAGLSNFGNFVLFQVVWFACVLGAAEGHPWLGVGCTAAFALVHVAFFARAPHRFAGEVKLLLLVTLIGTVLDSGLRAAGLLGYSSVPESWPSFLAPPWIIALWTSFAALLRHSLSWLRPKLVLAFLFGAIGGPMSFLGGRRLGAVDLGEPESLALAALAVEWALLTPLLLRFALPSEPTSTRK